jgi:hypothetical protein
MFPFILHWRHQIGFDGHDADYVKPANLEMLRAGFAKFLPQFSDMLNSMRPEPSLIARCAAALLVLMNPLLLSFRSRWLKESPAGGFTPILSFIALHNCVYFGIVLLSRHAYFGEGLIQRFWVPVIVYSLYLTLVAAARLIERGYDRPIGRIAVPLSAAAVTICLAIVSIQSWPNRESFRSMKDHWADLRMLRERGATHVTADYWRSLPLNVLSQFEILAVPRDFSRTDRFRDEFTRQARRRDPHAFVDLK